MTWRLRKSKSLLDYLKKHTSLQTKDKGNMIKSLNKNFSANIILRTKIRNKEGVLSTPIAHYT